MSRYTPEMIARMKEVYTPDASDEVRRAQVKELAVEFTAELGEEVSVRSVTGKLTTEDLYVPYAKIEKEVKPKAETRDSIVDSLAETLGLKVTDIASFKRSNRGDLINLREAVNALFEPAESE